LRLMGEPGGGLVSLKGRGSGLVKRPRRWCGRVGASVLLLVGGDWPGAVRKSGFATAAGSSICVTFDVFGGCRR
jgi:hypothetical protein